MKKVAFMFVAAMAMSFAACTGNKPAEQTEATEAIDETVEAVEEAIDTLAQQVDTAQAVVEEAAAEVLPE